MGNTPARTVQIFCISSCVHKHSDSRLTADLTEQIADPKFHRGKAMAVALPSRKSAVRPKSDTTLAAFGDATCGRYRECAVLLLPIARSRRGIPPGVLCCELCSF